jgi:hypothetical protein
MDILRKHSGYKFFAKLDASMQYYTFKLDNKSQDHCTIITPFGKYKYLRLPMGLKCSPDISSNYGKYIIRKYMKSYKTNSYVWSHMIDMNSYDMNSHDENSYDLNSYDIMNSYIHWWWCFLHWLESPRQAVSHHFMLTTQKMASPLAHSSVNGPSEKINGLDIGLHHKVYTLEKEHQCHTPHGLTLHCHRTVHIQWLRKLLLWHVAEMHTYP